MNLAHALAESARAVPDRPAIVVDDQVDCSYATMAERVARRAGDLTAQGVGPGDRVAMYMGNRPDYLEALFATWWAGAVAVPLSSMLHPREAADLIADCAARFTWVSPELAEGLDAHLSVGDRVRVVDEGELARSRQSDPRVLAEAAQNSDAWLFYTSGTTGKPKGARLTHANLWAMSLAYCADVEWVDERSGLLHLALQSHASGLFALPFIARGGAQVVPTSTDPEHVARLLAVHERLTFFVPPILLRRLAADPAIAAAPVDRMGTVLVGAAPVHADDLRAGMATFGPRLWNGYGQGESPCTITALGPRAMAEAERRGDSAALGSVGCARVGTRVALVDSEGQSVPYGDIGEVVVKGPTVMAGYLDRPEATAETLRDGWLHTGDLGRFENGLLTLLDRSKDMVISGGANVYPREVEDVIRLHPQVADIAVVGIPDQEWGERVVAFIVPEAGSTVTDDALDTYCLTSMARYKRPKEYHVVSELPRNGAGKVLKTQLREQLLQQVTDMPRTLIDITDNEE
jgi:long-chain acyl-CoA synthetase